MVRWNSDLHEKLLVIALDVHKLDYGKISERWNQKHGDQPALKLSASAISQHLDKLRGKSGGVRKSAAAASPRPAARAPVAKPNRANVPKTPSSSSGQKRKRELVRTMSDEDDTEAEKSMLLDRKEVLSRRSIGRQSKTLPKLYNDDSGEEDEAEGEDGEDGKGTRDDGFGLFGLGSDMKKYMAGSDASDDSDLSQYDPAAVFRL